jgi:hypothetical protein
MFGLNTFRTTLLVTGAIGYYLLTQTHFASVLRRAVISGPATDVFIYDIDSLDFDVSLSLNAGVSVTTLVSPSRLQKAIGTAAETKYKQLKKQLESGVAGYGLLIDDPELLDLQTLTGVSEYLERFKEIQCFGKVAGSD